MKPFLLRIVAFLALASAAAAAERPNLLWITAEDLSPTLGAYGDTFARTPNLDAFARQAVRYTRAFATAPVCAPSRVALITGVYANSLGNPHLRCYHTLPPGFAGYPVDLRRAGYFTSNRAKTDYNLRDERRIAGTWWNSLGPQAHWRQRAPGQPFMSVFNIEDTHQSRDSAWPPEQFERAIGSRLAASERADLRCAPVPPFYPDTPSARAAMARYYDCVTVMDQNVGDVLRQLEADGLADDTIVFFYGDHGMGMPRGKRLLHDSGMRVPLLIRFPAKWAHLAPAEPGESVDRLVNFSDFAPTLLSLAGVSVPAHYQGRVFLGGTAGAPRRYVFGARDRVDEVFDTARSIRDERWLYLRNFRPHHSWAPPEAYSDQSAFRRELLAEARAGRLGSGSTAWLAPTRPREELYDTLADPHQLVNLAAAPEHAGTLARLRTALREWLVEIRDSAFLPETDARARAEDSPVYDAVRRPGVYPFERILAAAELVGDQAAVDRQQASLRDDDAAVRYWAAVGFAANPAGARAARGALERALTDSAPAVRIEATGALVAATGAENARRALLKELASDDALVALHAARTLELLGASRSAPVLADVRGRHAKALERETESQMERYIGFSLGSLLRAAANSQP